MFQDRVEAASRLADCLCALGLVCRLAVGLPRSGVPMAAMMAQALGGKARVLCVRKNPSPSAAELVPGGVGLRHRGDMGCGRDGGGE